MLATRRDQYRRRSGRELGDDNIWVIERRRELRSLEAIIERLAATGADESVAGAGHRKAIAATADSDPRRSPICFGHCPATPPHGSMTAARSTDGLKNASRHRRTEARGKIKKALREMLRAGVDINPNAVARHAGVARKTIYNHTDLFAEIRAASTTPRP